nr:MAG TPA: hypothetical protein [Bacteriophage sp.]
MKKENKEIIAYKGFDKNLKCRDYQYEIGKTFEHDGAVKACESGFHACEYPLDVFSYYPPSSSRFAIVKMHGETSKDSDDTKIASAKITIETEIKLPEMINRAVDWIKNKINWSDDNTSNTGDWSAATNTGNRSAATNTGNRSAATNTGNRSAATNTGDWSAATNTGDWSAATNTGRQSAAEVSGCGSVAIAIGRDSKSKADNGGAIVCVYRDCNGDLMYIKASKVGEDGIKANTWYTLDANGEFVEVENDE